jgi:hypothetical protein
MALQSIELVWRDCEWGREALGYRLAEDGGRPAHQPASQSRIPGCGGRAAAQYEQAVIHPAAGEGGDDLRRNPGAAAAASCLSLPGTRPDVYQADRLVAWLFAGWGVQSRLPKVDRDIACASETKTASGSAMSDARLVRPLLFPCLGRAERFDTGPASDRYRRIFLLAVDPSEGRFAEPTAGAQPWPRERVLMPLSSPPQRPGGSADGYPPRRD